MDREEMGKSSHILGLLSLMFDQMSLILAGLSE